MELERAAQPNWLLTSFTGVFTIVTEMALFGRSPEMIITHCYKGYNATNIMRSYDYFPSHEY